MSMTRRGVDSTGSAGGIIPTSSREPGVERGEGMLGRVIEREGV